jgi:hypothetical protein
MPKSPAITFGLMAVAGDRRPPALGMLEYPGKMPDQLFEGSHFRPTLLVSERPPSGNAIKTDGNVSEVGDNARVGHIGKVGGLEAVGPSDAPSLINRLRQIFERLCGLIGAARDR